MKNKIISTFVSIAALSAITNIAWAAGTASGTDIDNTASISYKVENVDQTDIYSTPGGNSLPGVPGTTGAPTTEDVKTTFVVDTKIDLTVTEGTDGSVVPSATAQDITYTLTNTGNSTEYFKLEETQVGSDQFDVTGCTITAAAPAVAGTGANTYQLGADAASVITVSCDIPDSDGTVVNNAKSNVDLKATAVTDTTGATAHTESAADTAAGVEVVLADANATTGDADATDGAARNASHSAVNSYIISTADLTVEKTEAVTAMPINGADDAGDTNFHIPGATITYTIVVTNKAAEATHLKITDAIPAELSYVGCTLAGDGIENATAPDAGVALGCSNSGTNVTTTSFTLPAGTALAPKTATLTINATVN